jgi:large subunit ribosomal protein L13
MKTYSIKEKEIDKKWLLIDAKGLVLGRLACEISKILRGKHKPIFTPHMDCGDKIVVINARHIKLTGKKADLKEGNKFYWHTGFPGGIKETTSGKILQGKHPERVLKLAVERMIKRNVLGKNQMKHLYIYPDEEHKHEGQKPEFYDFASKNPKNTSKI